MLRHKLRQLCVKEPNIFLEFVSVQEQHGHFDCGVFAIALATSLCAGHSPAKTTYSIIVLYFCKKSINK